MKVAIIGTVGVPANYGGFETLVDNIVRQNRSDELEYSVYCSSKNYNERHWVYRGAKVVYIPLKANGIQSIFYDVFSVLHAFEAGRRVAGTWGFRMLHFTLCTFVEQEEDYCKYRWVGA